MSFFGVGGDRFRSNKEFTPGPGDYDPTKARGFKADPKSGFLTGDRFHDLEREGKPVVGDKIWSACKQKGFDSRN